MSVGTDLFKFSFKSFNIIACHYPDSLEIIEAVLSDKLFVASKRVLECPETLFRVLGIVQNSALIVFTLDGPWLRVVGLLNFEYV